MDLAAHGDLAEPLRTAIRSEFGAVFDDLRRFVDRRTAGLA